jgi:alginate O-acetyltransferase complex protein AlgI
VVFSSLVFIFLFLPVSAAVYSALPGIRAKNVWLIIVSLFFYAWGEPFFVLLMVGSIFLNYLFGLAISTVAGTQKKLLLGLALALNLGFIGLYKYADFAVRNINLLFGADFALPQIMLPLGISFFTFQAMSYIIDVYRGDVPVQKNFFYLLLYISFFPQLVAGPIVRYETICLQITKRVHSLEGAGEGIRRFLAGLAKKVLIANQLALIADEVFISSAVNPPVLTAWLAMLAYFFQIYFDFSGYSDMAIGLARIFGFEFEENFNFPYISRSVSEFWRRWHISLGSWFRDYLYFPLGGSRVSRGKEIRNLFIVWLLTGLWHGASWNFIFWGLYFFFFIVIERLFLGKFFKKHTVLSHAYLCVVVFFGWVLFRAASLTQALNIYKIMFFGSDVPLMNAQTLVYANDNWYIFLAAAVLSTPALKRLGEFIFQKKSAVFSALRAALYVACYVVVIIFLANSSYNPFIYFRF